MSHQGLSSWFKALDRWNPNVAESTLIGTGKEKGGIRLLTLENNDTIIERLDFYDENSMLFNIGFQNPSLPIENFMSTITASNKDKI